MLAKIESLPRSLRTSMQRDLERGNALEIDEIAGSITRRASAHGLDCNEIVTVIDAIHRRECDRNESVKRSERCPA